VSKPIPQNIPDAEKLINMKSEELAGYLLEHLHSITENRRHRFQPDNLTIEISRGSYPSAYEEKISDAIRKGYQWLKNRDYIFDRTANGFFDFTEKGEEIKTAEELRGSLRAEQMSKSSISTELMSDRREAENPNATAPSTTPTVNDPPLLNNRYKILRPFPTSGFGQTFLAEDVFLPSKRKCVIKQFTFTSDNPDIYQLMLERFEREAVNLENLARSSEQIPDLYAHFSENGQFYLVQEWVEGETVANRVKVGGPLGEDVVKDILKSILHVLNYVHSHSKIHRDIKPENIILREGDDKPCLIDFGSVKEIVRTVVDPFGNPSTTIVVGTPGFMPMEQISGKPLFASDIYALGLTAIYMLTGKRPQELTDLRTGDITWRDNVREVSTRFASILDKATRTDFRERFSTAGEMLDALSDKRQATIIEPQGRNPEPSEEEAFLNGSQSISSSSERQSRRTNADYVNRALRAASISPLAEELLQHLGELQTTIKQSGQGGEADPSLSEEINHLQGEINGLYKLSEGDIASHMLLKEAQTLLLKLRDALNPAKDDTLKVDDEKSDEESEYSFVLDAARQVKITNRQRQWRTSDEGVSSARREVSAMYAYLERHVSIANEKLAAAEAPISIELDRNNDDHFIISSGLYSLSVTWDCKSDSTLEDSVLSVRGYKKGIEEEQYSTADYDIEMNRDLVIGWRRREQRERFISTDRFAKELLEDLVGHVRSQAVHGK
jgi:serine/threonine protein kinase